MTVSPEPKEPRVEQLHRKALTQYPAKSMSKNQSTASRLDTDSDTRNLASTKGKRHSIFPFLDGIRGIAAFVVMFRHMPIMFSYVPPNSYLAVDIFFLMSGIVIANAYEHKLFSGDYSRQFFKIRSIRIYPMVFIGVSLGLINWIFSNHPIVPVSGILPAFVLSVLLIPNLFTTETFPLNGPQWSLFYEMLANFFYGKYINRLTNRTLLLICSISMLGLAIGLAFKGTLDTGYTLKSFPIGLSRVGFSFFGGVLLYRIHSSGFQFNIGEIVSKIVKYAILSTILAFLIGEPSILSRPVCVFLEVVIAFPLLVYVLLSISSGKNERKVLDFLGTMSYPIYAVHKPIIDLISYKIEAITGLLHVSAPALGALTTLLVIACAWMCERYYDRPLRKVLTAWFRTPGQSAPPIAPP